jgi:hypothetical protein
MHSILHATQKRFCMGIEVQECNNPPLGKNIREEVCVASGKWCIKKDFFSSLIGFWWHSHRTYGQA